MKITQLLPAAPGLRAVFVDVDSESGLHTELVAMYGCIEFEGETLVDAMTYAFGEGYVPCTAQPHFIGLAEPDDDLAQFADAEKMYREERDDDVTKAN